MPINEKLNELMDQSRRTFSIGGGPREIPSFYSDTDRMRLQLNEAHDQIKKHMEVFEQLQEQPNLIGCVLKVMGKRAIIGAAGSATEVAFPERLSLVPGDQVRLVSATMQILGKLDTRFLVGTAVQVTAIHGDQLIVEVGGTKRVIERGKVGKVEIGWSALLDSSGVIAIDAWAPEDNFTEESPEVQWADIGGLEPAKEAIREAIEYPITHAELYKSYGKAPSKGVLLYGPPGCGKTMLGRAAATALRGREGGAPGFIYVKGPEVLTKWVGESEGNVRRLFDQCRDYKRRTGHSALLFIDEADALLGARKNEGSAVSLGSTIVPAFLTEMDGLTASSAFVMLATNRHDMLDSAVTRDGRIDRRIEITRPARPEVEAIFRIHLRGKPVAKGNDLESAMFERLYSDQCVVVKFTMGDSPEEHALHMHELTSGAMVAGIVARATELAIKRDREAGATKPSGLTSEDVIAAVDASCSEIKHTDLRDVLYQRAQAHRRSSSSLIVN